MLKKTYPESGLKLNSCSRQRIENGVLERNRYTERPWISKL